MPVWLFLTPAGYLDMAGTEWSLSEQLPGFGVYDC